LRRSLILLKHRLQAVAGDFASVSRLPLRHRKDLRRRRKNSSYESHAADDDCLAVAVEQTTSLAGTAYVMFGKFGGLSNIDLANLAPSDGFALMGPPPETKPGTRLPSQANSTATAATI
jgi:hypothetical protein